MNKATVIQIDLETLSLDRTKAVVLAVGVDAMELTLDGAEVTQTYRDGYYVRMDEGEQMRDGRVVDPATLRWWLSQDDDARQEIAEPAIFSMLNSVETLSLFLNRYKHAENLTVLSSEPELDFGNLRSLLAGYGYEFPFVHTQLHHYRTLRALGIPQVDRGSNTTHNALGDAKHQNNMLLNAVRRDDAMGSVLKTFLFR